MFGEGGSEGGCEGEIGRREVVKEYGSEGRREMLINWFDIVLWILLKSMRFLGFYYLK